MRQEIAGGYLWSPVTEANGARSRFYDNMRAASPGDIVLSYAEGRVGGIGIVADFAISAPKPEEFGRIGAYWSAVGWLLPVQWLDTELAVRPKDLLSRLAPLLPPTHSPIQPLSGNGNQKAYLAEVDRGVIDLILEAARLPHLDLLAVPSTTNADFATTLDDLVERSILDDASLDATVREQLTRARRGQGLFRKRVLEVEPSCRITGVDKPSLLIPSHIKPWRACGTAAERLDGFNGLMLAPHADFLFDHGLIGFEEDGHSLFSSQLKDADAVKLGLHMIQRPPPRPMRAESHDYIRPSQHGFHTVTQKCDSLLWYARSGKPTHLSRS
ncbi:HNH endonuclease [Ancylobacter oerskovii]|uniref:HNH endonuclease n=1 Tax=Ancylobacter oerskovii TaxID=459519 RepID=A0ABW4Z013_9HYPH|nr:HNH endonuclease [Ancylobacter oerskovii]